MKLLVTGSAGFIGGAFMEAAKAAGHEPFGIDKKMGVNIVNSARMYQILNQMMPSFDMIIHLAATCSTSRGLTDPAEAFENNVIGTFNICEMARNLVNKPVIYTSTCKVVPTDDRGMMTPYGMTKYVGEVMLKEYAQSYGVPYIINRPGTIYGPGQEGSDESGWLAWFIKASLETLPVTIFGDGKQTRDVLYIEDYVKLLLDQVENFQKYQGKTFEVGGGQENELSLLKACALLNFTNYNFGKPRPGDAARYVSNNERVSAVTGWKPTVGYEEGIKKTVEYYKSRLPKVN